MTTAADLTHGPIRRQLIALALPLLAGNILQQLYNTIDAVIVGRFVGDGAFAAVGVAGSVMNLFLLLLSGGCSGVGVLLSQLHGAGDGPAFRRDLFLSSLFRLLLTLALTGAALVLLSPLLVLLRTPEAIRGCARDYLRIIFLGFPAAFAFHQGSAVLRAVGYLRLVACFYLFNFLGSGLAGYFQGRGRVNIPVIGATGHITLRVILSWLLAPRLGLPAVALATGLGWVGVVTFWSLLFRRESTSAKQA